MTHYTKQYKIEKSAKRPFGVVAVVMLFGVFSFFGAALLVHERDSWLIEYVALNAILVYLFRRLWWGDDEERKIAVFVGFLMAALTCFVSMKEPVSIWTISEMAFVVEGCYFFLAACYLIYARKNLFFASDKVGQSI